MNKEDAHLYLPFMQALADGKIVQFRVCDDHWSDQDVFTWSYPPERYRIKPEPWEGWVVVWISGAVSGPYTQKSIAMNRKLESPMHGKIIKVREVTE